MMASEELSLGDRRTVVRFTRQSPCKAETSWTKAERGRHRKARTARRSSWRLAHLGKNGRW